MKVKELIEILKTKNPDSDVFVKCEGYTNYIDPKDEYEIKVVSKKGAIMIADGEYEKEYWR